MDFFKIVYGIVYFACHFTFDSVIKPFQLASQAKH